MSKPKLILVGDGGHAKIVLDILMEVNNYEIVGVTSCNENNKTFCGLPILGNDDVLREFFKSGVKHVAIGIGGFKNNFLRKSIFKKVNDIGFDIVTLIHPSAVISRSVKIGKGCVIFAGVVVNPDVKIGDNVIIATGSTIDHETTIEDHVLVSAGVTIGGNTKIGEGTLCALGSKIISGIKIGKNVLVASGAVVAKDLEDNIKVYGIPAKKL